MDHTTTTAETQATSKVIVTYLSGGIQVIPNVKILHPDDPGFFILEGFDGGVTFVNRAAVQNLRLIPVALEAIGAPGAQV